MKRTEVRRIAPMPSSTTPLRQKRPAKPGERAAEQVARLLVWGRAGGMCERCGLATATNYHHRKPRSHCNTYELWAASNALALCGTGSTGCHGRATEHPAEAYAHGWSVRSHQVAADVPVLRRGVLVLLDDLGSFQVMGDAA